MFRKGPFAANPFYVGECYYRKLYTPGNTLKEKRIFLRFESIASVAEVYVNTWYYSPGNRSENAPKNRIEKEKEHRRL